MIIKHIIKVSSNLNNQQKHERKLIQSKKKAPQNEKKNQKQNKCIHTQKTNTIFLESYNERNEK